MSASFFFLGLTVGIATFTGCGGALFVVVDQTGSLGKYAVWGPKPQGDDKDRAIPLGESIISWFKNVNVSKVREGAELLPTLFTFTDEETKIFEQSNMTLKKALEKCNAKVAPKPPKDGAASACDETRLKKAWDAWQLKKSLEGTLSKIKDSISSRFNNPNVPDNLGTANNPFSGGANDPSLQSAPPMKG